MDICVSVRTLPGGGGGKKLAALVIFECRLAALAKISEYEELEGISAA